MRLIDADRFKGKFNTDTGIGIRMRLMIDKQPTGYDVDKVVEQLEDLKRWYWFTIANTGDKKLDCAYENVGNALDRAIKIVKSGGVADD